jgi:glycerol-3-phosphate dehydrogenase
MFGHPNNMLKSLSSADSQPVKILGCGSRLNGFCFRARGKHIMDKRTEKLKKNLAKNGFADIECSEWRSSVRLEGERESWDKVVRAGKIAAKAGFKAVVNDITLKGFTLPPIKEPSIKDSSLEGLAPDVLIIGGGVIGCAIARELSKYAMDIILLEKESDIAMHTSSRNDGMIHPGIASHPGTLRGEMNVRGNLLYTDLCRDLSVPFERYGSLVLYSSEMFGMVLAPIFARRERLLGIEGHKISRRRLEEIEPNITDKAVGAFEYPSSGVLSPYKLTVALADNAVENGVRFSLDTIVKSIESKDGKITGVTTNRGVLRPRLVINAAGVYADTIAKMAGDGFFTIHPRKGECAILDKKKGPLVTRSMGMIDISMASSDTKGGGVMRTIDNNVLVGPDAYEQPFREDYSTNAKNMEALLSKHLPLIKGFSKSDVITYFSGIRASTYEEEFIIEKSDYVMNLVHAAGIQSPGLASAPAIAERIAAITVEVLTAETAVVPNEKFNPRRRVSPVMAKLSLAEKHAAIKENPDYGNVICRCEGISKGEIIDTIKSPLPAVSVDAVKRRSRPGMGRCQGSFCSPLVMQIICEQTGMKPCEVTKNGEGSNIVFSG